MRSLERKERAGAVFPPAAAAMADNRLECAPAPMPNQRDMRGIDCENDLSRRVALQRQFELSAIRVVQALMPEPITFRFPTERVRCRTVVNFRDR